MTENASLRVLISAYQCGPGMGSVSQIGWQWYSRLAQRLPVTLVTHIRNQAALQAAGAPIAGSEIIYIDTEWFAGPLYRASARLFPKSQHAVFLMSSLDFYVYDRAVVKQLKPLQKKAHRWQIVHAPTPVSPTAASRLYQLQLPLVLGPWNGGIPSPRHFPEIMRQDSAWLYPLRNLSKIVDWILGSTRNATMILTANQATQNTIPKKYRDKCVPLLENGVDLNLFSSAPYPPAPSPDNPLHLVFVGRLVPFKGVGMLLTAISSVKDKLPIRLTVIGEGPLGVEWQQQARGLGIGEQIHWLGNANFEQIVKQLHHAHALCLPSVRESGGGVLLEAMACARPVIAVAFGGPAEVVDDDVGYLIPPNGQKAVIQGLVSCFFDIYLNPQKWAAKGEEGRKRAERYYGWDAKVEKVIELYQQLIKKEAR